MTVCYRASGTCRFEGLWCPWNVRRYSYKNTASCTRRLESSASLLLDLDLTCRNQFSVNSFWRYNQEDQCLCRTICKIAQRLYWEHSLRNRLLLGYCECYRCCPESLFVTAEAAHIHPCIFMNCFIVCLKEPHFLPWSDRYYLASASNEWRYKKYSYSYDVVNMDRYSNRIPVRQHHSTCQFILCSR